MWGGCQWNVKDRYQQYTNENNIYLLENVEELSMWRRYDRFWNHYYDNHWDQAPEFKDNLYWGVLTLCRGWDNFTNDTTTLNTDPTFNAHCCTFYQAFL